MTPHTLRMLHDLFSQRQYSQSPFHTLTHLLNCQVITNLSDGKQIISSCMWVFFWWLSSCVFDYPFFRFLHVKTYTRDTKRSSNKRFKYRRISRGLTILVNISIYTHDTCLIYVCKYKKYTTYNCSFFVCLSVLTHQLLRFQVFR